MNDGILRVLSIDYDYFQNVDENTYRCIYPDGKERGTKFSELIWGSKYMYKENNERLMKVTLNKDEFNLLRVLLAKQPKTAVAVVTDSHRHIVEAIDTMSKNEGCNGLIIDHIDMHPDVRKNDLKELDCGNWINFIKDKYKAKITWVTNPISDTFASVPEAFYSVKSSIADLPYMDYDLIFLCRSDCYLPPHLDVSFDKIYRIIKKKFNRVFVSNDITMPRTVSFKAVTSYADMMNTLKKVKENDGATANE